VISLTLTFFRKNTSAEKYELNTVMNSTWKSEFLENLSGTFEKKKNTRTAEQDNQELYAAIGQRKVENEFIK
jgi:transposase